MDQELRDLSDDERQDSHEGSLDPDFGASLRRAREQRGISLRSISMSTKISMSLLQALEREDVSRLPGGIFSRAFVRSYAREVGLDPEATVRAFIERFPTEDFGRATQEVHEFEENVELEWRRAIVRVALKVVGVSVPIAGALLYLTLAGGPPADLEPATESSSAAAVTEAPARPTARPDNVPTPVAREAVGPAPTVAAEATDGLRVTIRTTGPCWVSVVADGRRSFARLMEGGEQEIQQIDNEMVINVGDAGNFSFSINGVAGRSLGDAGQVVTVRITAENYRSYLRP